MSATGAVVTEEIAAAISDIIAYNWNDEQNDYYENCSDEPGDNQRHGHIFEKLMLVRYWLEYGAQAAYRPWADELILPPRGTFTSVEGYYSTAFHEGVHSTGHQDRRTGWGCGTSIILVRSGTLRRSWLRRWVPLCCVPC